MIAFLAKKLEQGGDFITGDKLTIADFQIANILFAHVYNDAYIGGAAFTDKGKAVVAEFEGFSNYIERLRLQLAGYLATRPAYPF